MKTTAIAKRPTTAALVTYEKARSALAACHRVDEAKAIRDKAEALRAYSKQANDTEMETWAAEIKLRAMRRIGEISKTLEKAQKVGKGKGRLQSPPSGLCKADALAKAGLTKQAANRCEKLAEIPEDEFESLIAEKKAEGKPVYAGQVVMQANRLVKETVRSTRRAANAELVEATPGPTAVLGQGRFATIVIDPPWDWGDEGDVDQLGRARPTYATLPFPELLALPVGDFADTDCHLYLWITNRSLPKGFELLTAWEFRYVTCLTWCKPSFGMGNYFRGQTEHVLFGVKGSQPLARKDVGTWFAADRGPDGHSSKPAAFFDLIESCSPGPYLEMFARRDRHGWKSWGAES